VDAVQWIARLIRPNPREPLTLLEQSHDLSRPAERQPPLDRHRDLDARLGHHQEDRFGGQLPLERGETEWVGDPQLKLLDAVLATPPDLDPKVELGNRPARHRE